MYSLKRTKAFDKDIERDIRSGRYKQDEFVRLSDVISKLQNLEELEKEFLNHQLRGEMKEYRECHIKPNWLLVYAYDHPQTTLELARLGTHTQIFKKYK